jgi:hypothetical protein
VNILASEELMPAGLTEDDYEEDWVAVVNKTEYPLSKNQALIIKQAMATGERGNIVFDSFAICIPFVSEFYRIKRYLKNEKQLVARAAEGEYKPIDPKKWEEIRKQAYEKIGKMP